MILDQQTVMSDAQVIPAGGAANSTNHIAFAAAKNLGAGGRPELVLHVKAKTGAPNVQAKLVGGNAVDANGAPTWADKFTILDTGVKANPALGFVRTAIPSHVGAKFLRIEYSDPGVGTDFTVTAGLAFDEQTAGNV